MINGAPSIRLIDFGFSCLKYNRLTITGRSDFQVVKGLFTSCKSKSRDLHSLLTSLVMYNQYIANPGFSDCPIVKILKTLLITDLPPIRNWDQSYSAFNQLNDDANPDKSVNLNFDVVYNVLNSVHFTNPTICSAYTGNWAEHLQRLYRSTQDHMEYNTYMNIRDSVVRDFVNKCVKDPFYILHQVNGANKFGITLLMNACRSNDLESVEKLAQMALLKLAKKDNLGNTCLHYACQKATNSKGSERADAIKIINILIGTNPALPDIKNNNNMGPGNPKLVDREIYALIKAKKSSIFGAKKHNTNKNKVGGKRKTLRRKRT